MTNGAEPRVAAPAPAYLSEEDCRLADLIEVAGDETDLADYPLAAAVERGVPVYDGARLREEAARPAGGPRIAAELVRAWQDGPGIVVFAGAFDVGVVDRATEQFEAIIAEQRAAGGAAGDHFARAGQNDRIWNALEKLAVRAPEVFAAYYANDVVAAACHPGSGRATRSPPRSTR
jgi:hypothetical protein